MPFSPGDRIGPYEILTPLGVGGMGEVFRVFDPRLRRTVALKILSAESARTPEYLKRFEHEARSASALNHPNVVGVYDIGAHLGLPYFAMELVEGRDLRDLLALGTFEMDRALDVATQVAEGLAAAHVRGVVHRDLKPENVMVTPEGTVKILDFGLAKRVVVIAGPTEETAAPGERLTGEGLIVGTVGYMAPEQARGEAVGPPADQFALGAIVFELLSGRRAFQKPTAVETLSSILHDELPPAETAEGPVPPEMQWILDRCLDKDPDGRYASTQDLVRELKLLRERRRRAVALASGALPVQRPVSGPQASALRPAEAPPLPPPVPPPSTGRRRAASAALVAGGLLAGALLSFVLLSGQRGATPASWTRLTFTRGIVRAARFAPDRKGVLFSAAWGGQKLQVRLVRRGEPEGIALPLPAADLAAVSPSGELAVVLGCRATHGGVCRGTLARAALAGGAPREVMAGVQQADFGPGGDGFVVVREVPGRSRLEYPPGKVLYETSGHVSFPRLSPEGDRIAFIDHPVAQDERGTIAVVTLAGKKATLTREASAARGLCWSPSGSEVWFTAAFEPLRPRALWAVRLGGEMRLVFSAPAPLTLHDAARDGRILVSRETAGSEAYFLPRGGERERNLSWLDASVVRDLSPDGQSLLLDEDSEALGGAPAVFVRSTGGSPPVRLGAGRGLALSPDGKWALLRPAGVATVLSVAPTDGGPSSVLGPVRGIVFEGAVFLPGGKQILCGGVDEAPGEAARLFLRGLDGGAPRPLEAGRIRSPRASIALSTDGKRVAALDPGGRLVLVPLAGGPAVPVAGSAEDDMPVRFSSDGTSLYVFGRGELPALVSRIDLSSGRREVVRSLMPQDPAGVERIRNVALTPDGATCAYTAYRTLSVLYLADGIR